MVLAINHLRFAGRRLFGSFIEYILCFLLYFSTALGFYFSFFSHVYVYMFP